MGSLSALALAFLLAGQASAIPANLPRQNANYDGEVSQPSNAAYKTTQLYNCQVRPGQLWVDVVFVIDTSLYMTKLGFLDTISFIQDTMSGVNIQPTGYTAKQFFTRAGIISYADTVTTWATLGKSNVTTFNTALNNVAYTGAPISNMKIALEAANNQFVMNNSTNPYRRKVIVLLTAVYNPNGVDSPILVADDFKGQGNVIIVYNFVAGAGLPDPDLVNIATPGNFIDSRGDISGVGGVNQLMLNLATANCFCLRNYRSPEISAVGAPVGGCYQTTGTSLISYTIASSNCAKLGHDGIVSVDRDEVASVFLRTFDQPNGWIGLQWDTLQKVYTWTDGTQLLPTDYQPFISPLIPPTQNRYCVARIETPGKTNWTQSVCTGGGTPRPFVCQLSPCDTARFCGPSDL